MTLKASLKSKTHAVFIKKSAATRTIRKKANGSDIFLGAVVTIYGESNAYDVDLAAEDETIFGIVSGAADDATDLDNDSDDCFADNANILVTIPVPGDVWYSATKQNVTVTYGQALQADGGFVENTDFSQTKSAQNVPSYGIVGIALEASTHVTSKEEYIQVMKT
jgi:hypothetical protein